MQWQPSEKKVARRAFELALGRELAEVIQEAKDRAAKVVEAHELWELERWLTQRRKEIDSDYEYRYSLLLFIFARLLREGRIQEDDLRGLGPDKLEVIRRILAPRESCK
ncbi:MAG TPA: hypothetical protein VGN16_26330 [Acidobacteriaceae bacterium]|jgi:hypothetical protein